MVFTLPSILNVTALTFLTYFIFSILTWFLFSGVRQGHYLMDNYANFHNFYESFLLLFRMSTGENWFGIMFDCTRNGGNKLATIYFIVYIILQQYIMLNLFILIIINQFSAYYINQDNPLTSFQEGRDNYLEAWIEFTRETKGVKINEKMLVDFLLFLKKPLGIEIEKEYEESLRVYTQSSESQLINQEEQLKIKDKVRIYHK